MYYLLVALIYLIEYIRKKKLITTVYLISIPYLFICLVNNYFMVNIGYQTIGDSTLQGLVLFTLCIFIGEFLYDCYYNTSKKKIRISAKKLAITKSNISLIRQTIKVILFCRIINTIYIIFTIGVANIYTNDFKDLGLNGLVGHLMIFAWSLIPFLFQNWLVNQEKEDLILTIFFSLILFTTFVKYNIIILVLVLFFQYCLYKKENVIKAILLMVILVVSVFLMNYIITFSLRDIGLSSEFLISKVWTYIAGGTIVSEQIAMNEHGFSLFLWLRNCFSGIINMIVIPLGGNGVKVVGVREVVIGSYKGAVYWTNVYSLLTSFLQFKNILEFMTGSVLWGYFNECVLKNLQSSKKYFVSSTTLVLLACNLLNFFGNYYTLSTIWELLIFSIFNMFIMRHIPRLKWK